MARNSNRYHHASSGTSLAPRPSWAMSFRHFFGTPSLLLRTAIGLDIVLAIIWPEIEIGLLGKALRAIVVTFSPPTDLLLSIAIVVGGASLMLSPLFRKKKKKGDSH